MASVFAFSDLINPVTRAEVEASLYAVYATLGLKTSSWKSGAVVRTMAVAQSIVISALSQLNSLIARSGFLELSEGPWLDIVAHYVYTTDRITATFASGTLTITNSGGGEYVLDPDDLIFTNPATRATYRNVAPVSIPAGPGVTMLVAIRATESGSSSTSSAGAITEVTTTLLGVTCSNVSDVVGRDGETDQDLRTRCSETLGAHSAFGPWDSYAFAMRNAKRPDGSTLGITRLRTQKDGYGGVRFTIATPSGGVVADDLAVAEAAIAMHATPFGVDATVLSANQASIVISTEVWMYNTAASTDAQVVAAIRARLTAFVSAQPIGGHRIGAGPGKIYRSKIYEVIGQGLPEIFHVAVTSPGADVELGPDDVITIGVPSIVIHQVEREKPPVL